MVSDDVITWGMARQVQVGGIEDKKWHVIEAARALGGSGVPAARSGRRLRRLGSWQNAPGG